VGDRVVVGIDGSVGAAEALRWAAMHAARTGAELAVLHLWEMPSALPGADLAAPGLRRDLEEIAQRTVDEAVVAARSMGDPTLVVSGRAVYGSPARQLTEASRSADLLVVGNVGHSLITGLLLGSVAESIVRHANCPVAVIPLHR
jgi:nucleotide-binding universal stress UspA family protein